MTAVETTDLDQLGRIFADPVAYADPQSWHAAAARFRAERPIAKVSYPGYPDFWAITKHADVQEIERNSDIFTNGPVPVIGPVENFQRDPAERQMISLVEMDGEVHKVHRAIVNDWFKPGNVKKLAGRVDELAKQYVDQMASMGGNCDFARDIAMHYPLQVILSILGLPESDYGRMLQLTQELFGAEDPDIGRAGEDQTVLQVMMDFVGYFQGLAADRRANPGTDLASVIANAELDGAPLPDMDVFGFYLIIATAGHDTTSNSIAGGLLAMLENRDQLELLQSRPELIDNAADEIIRYVSPVKHFIRHCHEPFTVRDVTFQPGDITLLSYASANRDDDVFDDPFRFDVTRPTASSQIGFGFGRHFCLGAHLARMEIRAFFRELLGRAESIELAGDPTFVQAALVTGPKTLPISYSLR